MSDQLGPDFDERLGAELDRVTAPTPLPENARFHISPAGNRQLGGRKLALAASGAVAVFMLAATVFAGSPNPAVWVSTVESVTHLGESSPSPSPVSSPESEPQPPAHTEPTEPSHESPEPSHESPEPSHESSEPSPSPETHESPSSSPSPTPDGHHESPSPSASPPGS